MRTYMCSLKGQFVSRGLTMIAEFIRANPTKSAVVFCNSRRQSQHFPDHLERKINKMKLNVDIIHINGSLHKTNSSGKYAFSATRVISEMLISGFS